MNSNFLCRLLSKETSTLNLAVLKPCREILFQYVGGRREVWVNQVYTLMRQLPAGQPPLVIGIVLPAL